MKLLIAFTLLFSSTALAVDELNAYYGADFYEAFEDVENGASLNLRRRLNTVLTQFHVKSAVGGFDEISKICRPGVDCYSHKRQTYDNAREFMFGYLDLRKGNFNRYYIKDVYCNKRFKADDGVGLGKIPNYEKISAEHTWPQSVFDGIRDVKTERKNIPQYNYMESDLHALFPSQATANSHVRANNPFGEVDQLQKRSCRASKKGTSTTNPEISVFEPPKNHKGDVARAMFYFATRYNLKIEKFEEDVLRKWHKIDPVDDSEFDRMEEIFQFQHTRNPYIDHPELVDFISNF